MKHPLIIIALIFSTLTPVVALVNSVSAAPENIDNSASAAQGMQISPALVELNGEAGKSYSIQLKVLNVTASDLLFRSSVNDFRAKDETGTPSISVDSGVPSTASIRQWVAPIPDFALRSHQSQTIDAVVTIPANAEPGGHYGVIRFSGRDPAVSGSGVGQTASAGPLVLVRVRGV